MCRGHAHTILKIDSCFFSSLCILCPAFVPTTPGTQLFLVSCSFLTSFGSGRGVSGCQCCGIAAKSLRCQPVSSLHSERANRSVTQTLCDSRTVAHQAPSVHGILQTRLLERLPFPSPGDLPQPGVKPRSSALPADLHREPPITLKNSL